MMMPEAALALMSLAVMVGGEVWRIKAPEVDRDAPLAQAVGVALAVGGVWPELIPGVPMSSLLPVILLACTAMVIGESLRKRFDMWDEDLVRAVVPVLIAGVLARIPGPGGQSLLERLSDDSPDSAAVSFAAFGLVAVAVVTPMMVRAIASDRSGRGTGGMPIPTRVIREFRLHGMLALATISTAVVIASTLSKLGPLAVLIGVIPMTVIMPAMTHHHVSRVAHQQAVMALSRVTDEVGLTPPEHAARVADLSVRLAREVGARDGDLRAVELAALLHDVGQVALRRPIPGGATSEVSASDQRRIAAVSAGILSRSKELSGVASMVADAGLQYAVVKGRAEVSLGSRIVRVASTYDDLAYEQDAVGVRRALRRMVRLVPEDLDPQVVTALIRHLQRAKVVDAQAAKELTELVVIAQQSV